MGTTESTRPPKSIREISFASGPFLDDLGAPLRSILGDEDEDEEDEVESELDGGESRR